MKLINEDINKLKFGLIGDKQVLFELKNSKIPMVVLPNTYFTHASLTSQVDYIVITPCLTYVIECKNLYGDIEINSRGEFIRKFTYGNTNVKEGFYSPVTQNKRHMDLLRVLRKNRQNVLLRGMSDAIFEKLFKSLIVLSNPKTILEMNHAPKEIKSLIIRNDQLMSYIEKANKQSKEINMSMKQMLQLGNNILTDASDNKVNYFSKYEPYIIKQTNQCDKGDISLKERLKEFRLNVSRKEDIKPYLVFTNDQLDRLIESRPDTLEKLMNVKGFGSVKCERYGNEILKIITSNE